MKESEFTCIKKGIPPKGIPIIGITDDGDIRYCFRCNCSSDDCIEWRDTITGYHLNVNIVKWKFDEVE